MLISPGFIAHSRVQLCGEPALTSMQCSAQQQNAIRFESCLRNQSFNNLGQSRAAGSTPILQRVRILASILDCPLCNPPRPAFAGLSLRTPLCPVHLFSLVACARESAFASGRSCRDARGDRMLQRFSPCCNGPESRINDSKARRISGFLKAVRFNLRTDRLKANVYRLSN